MVSAPKAHGQHDLQTHGDGSSLSKLQINNQDLRAGTFTEGIGQDEDAVTEFPILTRRASLPFI